MAQRQSDDNAFAEAEAKSKRIDELQDEKLSLKERMLHATQDVDMICQSVSRIPDQVEVDMNLLMMDAQTIESFKKKKMDELNAIRKRNEEAAQKQLSLIHDKEQEYKRKVCEVEAVGEECNYWTNFLQQKKSRVADLQEELAVETKRFVDQRVTLSNLRTASKSGKATLTKAHNTFQSDSAKLDVQFSAAQTDIQKLREENATIGDALAAVQSDNTAKSIELVGLRSHFAAIKAEYDREGSIELDRIRSPTRYQDNATASDDSMDESDDSEDSKYEAEAAAATAGFQAMDAADDSEDEDSASITFSPDSSPSQHRSADRPAEEDEERACSPDSSWTQNSAGRDDADDPNDSADQNRRSLTLFADNVSFRN